MDYTASSRLTHRYVLLALIAVELLMSFSFLGYVHIEPISVTLAYLPVLLAGALLGPLDAAALGGVFGLASMWKASASYVMPGDQLFSPIYSGNPLGSLVLSVGSRALFGLAAGLLYEGGHRLRHTGVWVVLVSFFGRTLHTALVYGAMYLFFPEEGHTPADALHSFFNGSNLLTNLVTTVIVVLLWCFSQSRPWMQFQNRLALARAARSERRYHRLSLLVASVVTLASALSVTVYFGHRIDYVLAGRGIDLSSAGYADIMHLQIQFMLGIASLMVLMILFLILSRQYNAYQAYEGKTDSLTDTMTRRAFFAACGHALRTLGLQDPPLGYFIMVDLDRFKEINDTYGHPEGDRALRGVAQCLRDSFGQNGLIGRLGGDEFAVLLCEDMSLAELEVDLKHLLEHVRRIAWGERCLTCSIGVLPIQAVRPPEELYRDADQLLYISKERGRNCYVIGDAQPAVQAAAE